MIPKLLGVIDHFMHLMTAIHTQKKKCIDVYTAKITYILLEDFQNSCLVKYHLSTSSSVKMKKEKSEHSVCTALEFNLFSSLSSPSSPQTS